MGALTPQLGVQTVEFANPVVVERDRWNTPIADEPDWVPVSNCRFRPLSVAEVVELYDRNEEVWKLTAPPEAPVLSAKPNGQIRYNSVVYEIDGGIKPFDGPDGQPFKVTVFCKRQQIQIA